MIRGIDVFSGEPVELEFDGDRIGSRTVLRSTRDLPYVGPGWLDLQVNGWSGLDWNSDDLSVDDAEKMCRMLAERGTTSLLPTLITASREALLTRLSGIRRACEGSALVNTMVAGVHVEGPFISDEDGPRGAHERADTRDPSTEELDAWNEASGERIRLVTLAPERSGATDFIRALTERGIIAAIGHTGATAAQIQAAVDAGARFSTHLGNGIWDSIHRHHNPVWPQLAEDRLVTGTIADGFHLPVEMLRVFAKAKHTERVVLVSDASAPGGRPPGTYRWSDIDVEVSPEGRLSLAGTPYLAGAGHLLDRGVKYMSVDAGLPLRDVVSMVTVNPHRLLGHSESNYALSPGAVANLTSFRVSASAPAAEIDTVIMGGRTL